MDFFRRSNWDIIGKTWTWYAISGTLIVLLMGLWAVRGLNYGIDFTGGAIVRYQLSHPVAASAADEVQVISKIRDALGKIDARLAKSSIQVAGGNTILIRTGEVANDEEAAKQDQAILQVIESLYGTTHGPIEALGRESVGPIVGAELRAAALRALIIGQLLILVYITIRYEFCFALGGILGLFNDLALLTGFMVLFNVELNSWFVAAILTVLGYSINDSVIIFDRIRENRGRHRHATLGPVVNASLLETMQRSINTTATTLFPLLALFFLAGPVMQGFALALLLGIFFGAYSSIFIAAPFVVLWDRWTHKTAGVTSYAAARPAATTAAEAGNGVTVGNGEVEAPAGSRPSAVETMRRAAEVAQEEKRQARRERRAKKRAKEQQRKPRKPR